MFNFIVFLTVFVIFFGPLIALIFLRDGGKSILSPFFLGVLIYPISIKGLQTGLLRLLDLLPGDATIFWSNKWFYSIFMGLSAGFLSEAIRFFLLNYRNKKNRWSSSVRRNAVMGLGDGWISAILGWGYFMSTVVISFFIGDDLSSYGLEIPYMIYQLLEQIIFIFLLIALTFIAQFGVKKHKIKNYYVMCSIIRALAFIIPYTLTYQFNCPMLLSEIIFAFFTAAIFVYGYILIKSLHSHKVRKPYNK